MTPAGQEKKLYRKTIPSVLLMQHQELPIAIYSKTTEKTVQICINLITVSINMLQGENVA
jgi:hypothetical protein